VTINSVYSDLDRTILTKLSGYSAVANK